MTLKVSGILDTDTKVAYMCTLVCEEVLHQFDMLSSEIRSKNPLTLEDIILEFGT